VSAASERKLPADSAWLAIMLVLLVVLAPIA
jgi:hypothetical protein